LQAHAPQQNGAPKTGTLPAKGSPGSAGKPSNTLAERSAPGAKPSSPGGNRGVNPAGNSAARQVSLKGGGSARIGANGQVRSVNRNGMQIQHNLHGGRTISSEKNGKQVVSTGKNSGYVQSKTPYATKNGKSYYSRTSYSNGKATTSSYQGYNYGGHQYYSYQPSSYYSPSFYGWAGSDWSGGISFGISAWGWGDAPWLGYYGFTPYPVYAGPAYWLTDYLLAADLAAAYAGGVVAVPTASTSVAVIANQPWTDSGMAVVQGQTYTIGAGGVINYNPRSVATPMGVDCGDGQSGLIAPQFPCIALLGKISPQGPAFFVGNTTTFTAPFTGELYLGVNDRYFPDNSGAWNATISQVGGADASPAVAASALAVPPTLQVCEQGGCSRWVWDGSHYNAAWTNGAISILTVQEWDANGIIINRVDPAGVSTGNTAVYTGRITGPNSAGGSIAGNMNGHAWAETWNANSPTPVITAAAAPVAAPATGGLAGGSDTVSLSPEVKDQIAEEVKAQLAEEKAEASGAPSGPAPVAGEQAPPALDPARRTFVVSADLTVVADGQECSLTPGDVILRLTDTPDGDQKVNVSVASMKKSDCAMGKIVAVSVDDLQEMRNQFDQKLDSGLKTLASKQGTGSLPKAPDTTVTASSVPRPPADPAAAQELQQQQAAADQAESEVKQEVAANAPGGN
jgi:hypothetical protein